MIVFSFVHQTISVVLTFAFVQTSSVKICRPAVGNAFQHLGISEYEIIFCNRNL